MALRCAALRAGSEEADNGMGIYLDYSRESVQPETLQKLFALAKKAQLAGVYGVNVGTS